MMMMIMMMMISSSLTTRKPIELKTVSACNLERRISSTHTPTPNQYEKQIEIVRDLLVADFSFQLMAVGGWFNPF